MISRTGDRIYRSMLYDSFNDICLPHFFYVIDLTVLIAHGWMDDSELIRTSVAHARSWNLRTK